MLPRIARALRGHAVLTSRQRDHLFRGSASASRERCDWVVQTAFSRRRQCPSIFDEGDIATALTREMRDFMDRVAAKPPDAWFHRKSEKLVLAVLMVYVDGEPRFVPGINAEVSLPAGGSLCAERSAIVAARALHPGIARSDFAGIAVVEVPLLHDRDPLRSRNPLRPCGACTEWLIKLQEANPDFRVVTYTSLELDHLEEYKPNGSRWEADGETAEAAPARWMPSRAGCTRLGRRARRRFYAGSWVTSDSLVKLQGSPAGLKRAQGLVHKA